MILHLAFDAAHPGVLLLGNCLLTCLFPMDPNGSHRKRCWRQWGFILSTITESQQGAPQLTESFWKREKHERLDSPFNPRSKVFRDLLWSFIIVIIFAIFSIFFSYFLSVQLVHLLVEIEKATMRRVCGSWNVWGWHTEKAPGRGSMAYHCDKKHETNRVGLEACHFCAIYVYMYIR